MTATDPTEAQSARRPSSRSATCEPGPCEGRQHLLRQSANAARPEWTAMIYPMLLACALMISSSLSTWTVLNWLTPSMQSLGIRMIERPEATYLIPYKGTTTLARCRLGTQTVDCLMIEEQ